MQNIKILKTKQLQKFKKLIKNDNIKITQLTKQQPLITNILKLINSPCVQLHCFQKTLRKKPIKEKFQEKTISQQFIYKYHQLHFSVIKII